MTLPCLNAEYLQTGQVVVSTSVTPIRPENPKRGWLVLTNLGNRDVYFGTSSVTPSTGDLLLGNKGATREIFARSAIYAIVSSGTQRIAFSEAAI